MNSTQGPKGFTSSNASGENNYANNKNTTAARRDASHGATATANSYLQNNSNSNQLGRVQVPGIF
jgi:hypothetical protein